MARNHGRILTAIWTDQDFRDRSPEAQRLYMFLLSQPNLNHAGLLPLTLRRWAGAAAGLTVADVRQALDELATARFVLVDEDAEELLIRTLVRNDGVWRQPKVMLAMEGDAREIASPTLQAAFVAELDRLDLTTLSDDPPKSGGESTRGVVQGVVDRLREAFAKATAGVSGRVSDTPAEPFEVPIAEGTGNPHACAGAPSPSPSPSPSPIPPTAGAVAPRDDEPATAQTIVSEWIERCAKRPPAQVIGQISKHVKAMLSEGIDADDVRRGLAEWMSRDLHPSVLPSLVNSAMNARAAPSTGRTPSTTDQRVADALDLSRRLAAKDDQLRKEITR